MKDVRIKWYRKHRYAGGVRSYYSEKYGELRIFPCLFEPDGSAVLTTENGDQLQLDKGFKMCVYEGRTDPCIAVTQGKMIRDLL